MRVAAINVGDRVPGALNKDGRDDVETTCHLSQAKGVPPAGNPCHAIPTHTCVRGWALCAGGEAGRRASRQGCLQPSPSASRVCWHAAADLAAFPSQYWDVCVDMVRAGLQSRTSPRKSFAGSSCSFCCIAGSACVLRTMSQLLTYLPYPRLQPSAENMSGGSVPAGDWEPRRRE